MIECLFVNKPFPDQPPEVEIGNKEYKRYFSFRYLNEYMKKSRNSDSIETSLETKRKRKRKRNNNKISEQRVQNILNQRASQMLYRIHEGYGKALYLFGVDDNGTVYGLDNDQFKDTLFYLEKIVEIIGAKIKSIKVYPCSDNKRQVITCRIIRELN